MKSKILKTVGLIAAMVACIGMTVFAEPSPAASTVVTGINSATDKDGKPVEGITITSDIPAEYSDAVNEIKTEAKLKEVLGDAYNENMVVVDIKEVRAPEGTAFPLTINFAMRGVTASTKVQMVRKEAASSQPEKYQSFYMV